MSVRSSRFCSWWNQDWLSQYDVIAFVCTIRSFTTLGECGLSLSLGLHPMKTHSSNHEMKSN